MKFVYLLNTSSYIPYFIYVEILIFNIIMFFVYHTFKNIYMIDYDIKREFHLVIRIPLLTELLTNWI